MTKKIMWIAFGANASYQITAVSYRVSKYFCGMLDDPFAKIWVGGVLGAAYLAFLVIFVLCMLVVILDEDPSFTKMVRIVFDKS